MFGLRLHAIRLTLACLSLSAVLAVAGALAQPAPPAKAPVAAPATLRLAQVLPRLPAINLYALAQDESGRPVVGQWGELSALVGSNNTQVTAGKDEGIAVVFLIDVSRSLNQQQFGLIKASVQAWIASMESADRAAVVTLGSSVNTVQDFTSDKAALRSAVSPMAPRDQQTLLYQGLVQAIDLSRRLDNNLPLRRAIVILTDGMDDEKGGAGRQEVLDKLAIDPTPIYGIGASQVKNAKVDAALKEFAGLVRMSGGDFRQVDVNSLDRGYDELRTIVRSTRHFVARCDNPPCAPDGSAIVVRLHLSQGTTELSSESVMVRAVGTEGKVEKTPAPSTPPPPPEVKPASPPPATVLSPPEPSPRPLQFVFRIFLGAPLQWSIFLAMALASAIAGGVILVQKRRSERQQDDVPVPTNQGSNIGRLDVIGVRVSEEVAIPAGTHQDRQRLRLYPIGRNDIQPQELLFEEDVSVGRAPEKKMCIFNDGQVSANHCILSPKGKHILVTDSGSRNGTRINGVAINGFMHAEPDSVLGVGRTELRMKLLPVGAQ